MNPKRTFLSFTLVLSCIAAANSQKGWKQKSSVKTPAEERGLENNFSPQKETSLILRAVLENIHTFRKYAAGGKGQSFAETFLRDRIKFANFLRRKSSNSKLEEAFASMDKIIELDKMLTTVQESTKKMKVLPGCSLISNEDLLLATYISLYDPQIMTSLKEIFKTFDMEYYNKDGQINAYYSSRDEAELTILRGNFKYGFDWARRFGVLSQILPKELKNLNKFLDDESNQNVFDRVYNTVVKKGADRFPEWVNKGYKWIETFADDMLLLSECDIISFVVLDKMPSLQGEESVKNLKASLQLNDDSEGQLELQNAEALEELTKEVARADPKVFDADVEAKKIDLAIKKKLMESKTPLLDMTTDAIAFTTFLADTFLTIEAHIFYKKVKDVTDLSYFNSKLDEWLHLIPDPQMNLLTKEEVGKVLILDHFGKQMKSSISKFLEVKNEPKGLKDTRTEL